MRERLHHDTHDQRRDALDRVAHLAEPEVLILGGGVNGVATLRDLALNGVSAVLLDTGDFCTGASGASSRMAHGGLRYLEGREFRLVAEAARERNRLLVHAPHLVHPLKITVPVRSFLKGTVSAAGRFLGLSRKSGPLSLASLKMGLFIYEIMGQRDRALPSHSVTLNSRRFPAGLSGSTDAIVAYFDGQIVQPEGLVLEMLAEAMGAGPEVAALNHVGWNFSDGTFQLADLFSDWTATIRPKVIVNAAGGWIDHVNAELGIASSYIRGVKGAHLVVDNPALFDRMDGSAWYFDDGTGRMVITVPVGKNILVGTTEVDAPDPSDKEISGDEIGYLLGAIDGLFTDISVTAEQVVAMTTGIRPLRRSEGSATSAARDHALETDRTAGGLPVLSLVGGKWTTFRAFAEQGADVVLRELKRSRSVSTADRDYPGAARCSVQEVLAAGAPDRTRAEGLLRRYGAISVEVAAYCAEGDDAMLPGSDYSQREIAWQVLNRFARTIEDVALRRTQLTMGHGIDPSALRLIANVMKSVSSRDPVELDREVQEALADPRIMGVRAERGVAA